MLKQHLFPHFLFFVLSSLLLFSDVQEQEDEIYIELPTYHVAGSHLPINSQALPLNTITTEEFEFWHESTAATAFRRQPFSFGTTNTENESNSGSGSAGANIHGLGNLSTLTLINGRRAGGNSALGFQHGGFADLNLIPLSAIAQIETITDGPSVAYGSDAVAGAVDIRLWQTYTGNRVRATYSDTINGDASEKTISFLNGQQISPSTHYVVSGSYYQRNAIFARDRDISDDTDRRDMGGQNQGSTTFPGTITVGGVPRILNDGIDSPSSISDYRTFDNLEDRFNFSESANAIPEVERKSLFATLTHELSSTTEIWGEVLHTNSEFLNSLAPAPWSGSAFAPTILEASRNSPFLPTGIAPADLTQINYRSFELGNLEFDLEKVATRSLIGLRGELNDFEWETAVLNIDTRLRDRYSGVAEASAVATSIENGEFNPFALSFSTGPGFDNAQALQEAERNPVNEFDESFLSYDFKVSHSSLEIPAGNIDFVAGADVRRESIDVSIDPLFSSGNNLGGAQANSFGAERDVFGFFAETHIPIFTNDNQSLSASLSTRYDHYSDQSTSSPTAQNNRYDAFVYRGSLFYNPTKSLSLYASYGTSYRAPTLTESYGAGIVAAYVYNDPVGPTPDSTRVFTFISGNDDLEPEESESVNLGINFQPEPDRGWRVDLNYYRVERQNVIVNSGQDVVNRDAGGVLRDGSGNLSLVFAEWFNAAVVETDGIDLDISFTQPTTGGYWQAQVGLNHVFNYDIQTLDEEPSVSFLGRLVDPRASNENIGGPGSVPEFKGFARFIWNYQALTLGATIHHIDSLEDNPAFTTNGEDRSVRSWTSLDLSMSYHWYENAPWLVKNTELIIGIENATDESPPFAAGAFADGYDASLYSLEGRRISLAISRQF